MAKERNPYRPGTVSYARFREAALKRRAALAAANAIRAKKPEARRRAKKLASAAKRALRAVERRSEFRSKLNEPDRHTFDRWSILKQEQLLRVTEAYPSGVPADAPDPFTGPQRSPSWRLYYSTRAGMRPRAAA
jgi:hypothetical protein